MQTNTTRCDCFQPDGRPVNPEVLFEGTDTTNSSYGEVTLSRCQRCTTAWLRFFIEYESFSRSGRWYRVPLPADCVAKVTAENAVAMVNEMTPRFAGGSRFNSNGFETTASVDLAP
jgi:hypothetical protein